MLRKILGLIAILLAALLLFAASQPDQFAIQRSALIKAPPEKIFPYINDFRQFALWSPWEKLDPAMTRNLSASSSGVGAFYEWNGNDKVGQGRMDITGSTPPNKVTMKLHFIRPFEANNLAEFTLAPSGDSTEVTWRMTGPSPFITKLIHVFFSMEKMVGPDFEAGLAKLKSLAEK